MTKKLTVHVGGRIPGDLAAQITAARKQTGMSQTHFMRRALETYLWMEGDLPEEVMNGISDAAEQSGMSVREAVLKCLEDGIVHLSQSRCRNCSMINDIEAHYCSNCGLPLNPKAREALLRLEEMIEEYPALIQHHLSTKNAENSER